MDGLFGLHAVCNSLYEDSVLNCQRLSNDMDEITVSQQQLRGLLRDADIAMDHFSPK